MVTAATSCQGRVVPSGKATVNLGHNGWVITALRHFAMASLHDLGTRDDGKGFRAEAAVAPPTRRGRQSLGYLATCSNAPGLSGADRERRPGFTLTRHSSLPEPDPRHYITMYVWDAAHILG